MMLRIQSRLQDLLAQRGMTPQALSEASGLPLRRIMACCDRNNDVLSLHEIGRILTALGDVGIADLFEAISLNGAAVEDASSPVLKEAEWHSTCQAAPDGVHRWYKDMNVSDSLYQEFVCQGCGKRLSVIL